MDQVDLKQEQTPLALDDLKVVELPALDSIPFFAGSMAGKALADLGAEVLKIEPPKTGSQERHFGPLDIAAWPPRQNISASRPAKYVRRRRKLPLNVCALSGLVIRLA